jgi:hypothetical protein
MLNPIRGVVHCDARFAGNTMKHDGHDDDRKSEEFIALVASIAPS